MFNVVPVLWKTPLTSGPRTIRPSSNVSPSGPLSDRPAFHPGVQPLLPRGFCRGGASALCAQHGLLHSGCARLQDSLPEGVSGSVFSFFSILFFYPPFNKTWKQFYILQFFYTQQLLQQLLRGRRESEQHKNVHVSGKFLVSLNYFLTCTLCTLPFFFSPDTWKRFPGWLLASF